MPTGWCEDYISSLDHLPVSGPLAQSLLIYWPVVQCGRVKVCAVGPYESVHFRINADLVEQI